MNRLAALSALAIAACAPRAGGANRESNSTVNSAASSGSSGSFAPSTEGQAALIALRDGARRGESEALVALSVELGRGGATEINGDAAQDERVASAEIAVSDDRAALVIVRTSCGNVRAIGLVRDGARWTRRTSTALVPEVRPGTCVRVTAVAQAVALSADPAHEAALGLKWEDSMGDEVHGPHLWVFGLDPARGFNVLLERAPFGGTDDRTGASTVGSLAVIDELPAPRPLFVEIRPGHRGVGGTAPSQRIVRRYDLREGRLVLSDEQQSSLGAD